LNPLKKLASQTVVYGLSSIVGRFLNYLLVPLYTYYFSTAQYGVVSEFYAYAGFFAVLLVFGLETGYFRFSQQSEGSTARTFSTALAFIILANLAFLLLIDRYDVRIAAALEYQDHPEYILWFGLILAMDATAALPFAKLRAENKAFRFAGVKITEILVAIGLNLFFIVYCKNAYTEAPRSFAAKLYDPTMGVGYIFISNLIASSVKLTLLLPQLRGLTAGFDPALFRKLMAYSLPMIMIGLAGIVNETLDRAILKYLLPYDLHTNLQMLGVYGACYKLSILMSLFIQAFRYAGEPFYFAHAKEEGARKVYADVMKYFVIFCVFVFLLVTLYIDIFQYFIGKAFRVGLPVVPILLMANLFLGIYVNLSIWYKLTDRTGMGAFVALFGSLVTVVLNIWWIPRIGYMGSAWATLACYSSMALLSYLLGRKYYRIEYDLKRITGYILLGLSLYFVNPRLIEATGWNPLVSGTLLIGVYLAVVALFELRMRLPRLLPSRR